MAKSNQKCGAMDCKNQAIYQVEVISPKAIEFRCKDHGGHADIYHRWDGRRWANWGKHTRGGRTSQFSPARVRTILEAT